MKGAASLPLTLTLCSIQATVLCDIIVLYCMKKRLYYREKKYKYVEDYEQVGPSWPLPAEVSCLRGAEAMGMGPSGEALLQRLAWVWHRVTLLAQAVPPLSAAAPSLVPCTGLTLNPTLFQPATSQVGSDNGCPEKAWCTHYLNSLCITGRAGSRPWTNLRTLGGEVPGAPLTPDCHKVSWGAGCAGCILIHSCPSWQGLASELDQ